MSPRKVQLAEDGLSDKVMFLPPRWLSRDECRLVKLESNKLELDTELTKPNLEKCEKVLLVNYESLIIYPKMKQT